MERSCGDGEFSNVLNNLIVLSKISAIIDTNFITFLFDSFLQFENQYRRGLIKAVLFVLDISTDTR